MATQEPNVLRRPVRRHRRPDVRPGRSSSPRSWANCCSGVGEDKMTFGKRLRHLGAQVADRGLRRLGLPSDGVLGLPAGQPRRTKKKILVLNAAKLTASRSGRVPAPGRRRARPALRTTPSWSRGHDGASPGYAASPGTPPGLAACRAAGLSWPPSLLSGTRSWTSRSPPSASSRPPRSRPTERRRSTCGCRPTSARRTSPSSWSRTPTDDGRRAARLCAAPRSCWTSTFASAAINGGVAAHAGFARSFDGEAVGELHDLRADFLRKAGHGRHRPGVPATSGFGDSCGPAAGADPGRRAALPRAHPAARAPGPSWACPAGDSAPLLIDPAHRRAGGTRRPAGCTWGGRG